MDNWQTYGAWQYQLLNGRDQIPPTLKEELQKADSQNCNTHLIEKIAAVYQYLASTTRYVSIQLGIGGLQPIAAADVHRTGFGDCKGLSNYMRAMLTVIRNSIHLYCNQYYKQTPVSRFCQCQPK